jgi:hypothetical protein
VIHHAQQISVKRRQEVLFEALQMQRICGMALWAVVEWK